MFDGAMMARMDDLASHRASPALALALAAMFALSACADRSPPSARSGPPAPSSPPAAAGSVPQILDFTASRLGGGQVVGAELAGKEVVVWFWAPW